ncbi:hypothetical protein [Luteimicrobium subarcticum]|uniref:Uncharacterized protein n=1 Tax=Luteimicrobium subarcticum TaxID=620910 RepID=A0A2M8W6S8_9MICO|nr:hypothetical protein [Luteimicrobium subarcticum]PJI86633.1 hypothetical protein CLV34_2553 [Luteimicrobium subarcticum]
MSQYIDLAALGRVVLVSLLVGAGLPALFAVGIKMLAPAAPPQQGAPGTAVAATRPSPARLLVASVCFGIVLAAIAWGVWYIAAGS